MTVRDRTVVTVRDRTVVTVRDRTVVTVKYRTVVISLLLITSLYLFKRSLSIIQDDYVENIPNSKSRVYW